MEPAWGPLASAQPAAAEVTPDWATQGPIALGKAQGLPSSDVL